MKKEPKISIPFGGSPSYITIREACDYITGKTPISCDPYANDALRGIICAWMRFQLGVTNRIVDITIDGIDYIVRRTYSPSSDGPAFKTTTIMDEHRQPLEDVPEDVKELLYHVADAVL